MQKINVVEKWQEVIMSNYLQFCLWGSNLCSFNSLSIKLLPVIHCLLVSKPLLKLPLEEKFVWWIWIKFSPCYYPSLKLHPCKWSLLSADAWSMAKQKLNTTCFRIYNPRREKRGKREFQTTITLSAVWRELLLSGFFNLLFINSTLECV